MWAKDETTNLWHNDALRVVRHWYHAERYPWGESYAAARDAVSLLRYGAFRRRSGGVEHVVDANTGFFRRRGEETTAANFTGAPEEFTLIEITEDGLGELLAEPALPSGPFRVAPDIDLGHRELLLAIRRGDDDVAIEEQVVGLVVAAVGQRRAKVVRGGRASTERNRRCLVTDACEVLHLTHGAISLQQLSRQVGASPFHLSRVFKSITGLTVSQYRLRLRVHQVLDRLAEGEDDLARLAYAVGFSDHSHMTRTVVAQLGEAPSALRRRLYAT
jgi:AraC-like DNA-binding protein